MKSKPPPFELVREARLSDIPSLEKMEEESFTIDRLSRKNFRYLITRAHSLNLVFVQSEEILAYSVLLFRRRSSLARLYSLAVSPAARGKKIGEKLLHACEQFCETHDISRLRLEVHTANASAIALYKKNGYQNFGMYADYYQDHADALRMEKIFIEEKKLRPARDLKKEKTK